MMNEECYFCGREVDEHEDFCLGCDVHVCDDCDLLRPIGPHEPRNHQRIEVEDDVDFLQIEET